MVANRKASQGFPKVVPKVLAWGLVFPEFPYSVTFNFGKYWNPNLKKKSFAAIKNAEIKISQAEKPKNPAHLPGGPTEGPTGGPTGGPEPGT